MVLIKPFVTSFVRGVMFSVLNETAVLPRPLLPPCDAGWADCGLAGRAGRVGLAGDSRATLFSCLSFLFLRPIEAEAGRVGRRFVV